MRLIFLEEYLKTGNLFILSKEESKHLLINRYRIGDKIESVFQDYFGFFEIKKIENKIISGEFSITHKLEKENSILNLIVGLPKDRALLPVIEKSSEIGVNKIFLIPLKFSDRKNLNESYIERIKKIAKEGCKQSGNPFIPQIILVKSLEEYIINYDYKNIIDNKNNFDNKFSLKIFLDERSDKTNNLFNLVQSNQIEKFKNTVIFIGPEGGISDIERDLLLEAKFIPVSLGKNILRTETAAICATYFIKSFQNANFAN